MVKVISAYNFQEQNTYSSTGDIAATCLIGSSRLAIAHRNHLIEIVTLKDRRRRSRRRARPPPSTAQRETYGSSSSSSPDYGGFNDQNDNCRQQNKIAFPTIDQVEQLHYCAAGNFLLTLEQKSTEVPDSTVRQQRYVRAYTNFDIANSENCFSIPIRARIASKTTPNVSRDDHIEVIEIQLYDSMPDLIACCQLAGTIAISCDSKLFFYEFRRRTNDSNKFQFIDFFEFPFCVELEFRPSKFAIAEHVVACLNVDTAVAFKIVDMSDINTEDGTTSNSMTTDSSLIGADHRPYDNFRSGPNSNRRRNEPIDFEVAKRFNQANGGKFRSDLRSTWDNDAERRSLFSEDRPILVNDIKMTVKNMPGTTTSANDRVFYSIRPLVQLRLHQQTTNQTRTTTAIHDEFRCLALKPIYYKVTNSPRNGGGADGNDNRNLQIDSLLIDNSHLMKSNCYKNCAGFSLFISTVSDGYMYQFSNHGKWYTENTKCLAIYPFTAPVIDIVIDSFVIHAITECGIETFSSRIGHKLFSSYFEYPMMSDPYPNETSPLVDVPICVMGICGFFGIKFVAASNENLILLTTDNERTIGARQSQRSSAVSRVGVGGARAIRTIDDSLEWTIYDLHLPKPETLVADIETLAGIYSTTSPDIYYELMEEAHIIIRLARGLMVTPIADVSSSSNDCNADDDDDDVILERSYIKTCKMLADFTIRSDRKEIFSQAIAYYSMCQYAVPDIYRQFIDVSNDAPSVDRTGLIYTLKLILSRIGSIKSRAEYLTQTIPGTSTSSDRTYADEFFHLFERHAYAELAPIALSSSVFREILHDRFERLYDDCEVRTPEETVCRILCLCHRHETDRALAIFETLGRHDIYTVLHEYWPALLFDNFQSDNYRKSASFSDLTESILFVCDRRDAIEAVADIFIRLLIQEHRIDLDFVLKLFMNYFAINVGQKGYRTSQNILEILLQAYFCDFYSSNDRNALIMLAPASTTAPPSATADFPTAIPAAHSSIDSNKSLPSIIDSNPNNNNNNSLQLSEESSTANTTITADSNYDDPEFEAMKILFRMYLGLLKQCSTTTPNVFPAVDPHDILPDVTGYRLAFIDYMFRNVALIKDTHCKFDRNFAASNSMLNTTTTTVAPPSPQLLPDYDDGRDFGPVPFRRTIVFFESREMFLNRMEPLNRTGCFRPDFDGVLHFDDWDSEISVVLIKIQALLSSGKLDSSLIGDFVTFVHSNPAVIGIDSLLAILLPKSEGVELLIHANPRFLLDYAKCRLSTPTQWQVLFKRILIKKRELSSETQQDAIELYDRIIDDILRSLVASKLLDDFLACIPEQEINRSDYSIEKDNSFWKLGKYRTRTQDGVDETNPFEVIMREAVAKQRSDALCAMIQSSGRQLNDAVNNYQLNFN